MGVRVSNHESKKSKSDPCIGIVGKNRKRDEKRQQPYVSETRNESTFVCYPANLLKMVVIYRKKKNRTKEDYK